MEKYIKVQDFLDAIYPVDPDNDGSDGCTVVTKSLHLTSEEIEAILNKIPSFDFMPVMLNEWMKVNGFALHSGHAIMNDYRRMEELHAKIKVITGLDLEQLVDMFAAGAELVYPAKNEYAMKTLGEIGE